MNDIHVLDLTRVLAGPWAAQHLADQGADVIKVEPPEGDETRQFGAAVNGTSTYYLAANRNKRAITLDLKTEGGQQVLERLLGWADVVMENFRPGVAARLGLDWEDLKTRYPRLVYVAIHAFGDQTPGWSERPGYDLMIQHMGGATTLTGWPGTPPTKCATSSADLIAGLYATQAVLLGLLHRERCGVGQKIVINMLQTQASCLTYHATRWALTGEIDTPRGNAHAGIVPYDVFRCADGWLTVACTNDGAWVRLCRALGLTERPEWSTNRQRIVERAHVTAAVATALAALNVQDADSLLTKARVACGPVLSPDQTLAHPAVEGVIVEDARLGPIPMPGPAFRSATTRQQHTPAPEAGAHTLSILQTLGIEASFTQLQHNGAFGPASNIPLLDL
jgi:CoA:oxalate CoA-transferase